MQRTTVTLICDICQTDQDVYERALTVNGKSVVAEVCNSDWPEDELDRILAHGRRPGTKPRDVTASASKKPRPAAVPEPASTAPFDPEIPGSTPEAPFGFRPDGVTPYKRRPRGPRQTVAAKKVG